MVEYSKPVFDEIVKIASEAAINKYREEKKKEEKKKLLHNVDLMLKIYPALNKHIEKVLEATSELPQLKEQETNLVLESVHESKALSALIISNIQIGLKEVRKEFKTRREEEKVDLLEDYYFNGYYGKVDDLADMYDCDRATIYRRLNTVRNRLGTYIFGISYFLI